MIERYTRPEMGAVWSESRRIAGWLAVEKLRDGHATSLGAASGVVAGLVARAVLARGVEREQLKWIAFAGVLMVIGIAVSSVFDQRSA